MDLRSDLSKAKGTGISGHGSHHWLMQRFTAIALVFLVGWFITRLVAAVSLGGNILAYFSSPLQTSFLILLINVSLYHGYLGLKVIIEDYIHCSCVKLFSIILVAFLSVFLAVISTLAIAKLHFQPRAIYGHCKNYEHKKENCHIDGYKKRPVEKFKNEQ